MFGLLLVNTDWAKLASVLAAISLSVALLYGQAAQAAEPAFEYEGSVQGDGTDAGKFERPLRLALDSTGRLFVSDFGKNRVQIFSGFASGNMPIDKLYGTGGAKDNAGQCNNPMWPDPPQFDRPASLSIDPGPSHALYVVDYLNHRIQVFKPAAQSYKFDRYICTGGEELENFNVHAFDEGKIYIAGRLASFCEGETKIGDPNKRYWCDYDNGRPVVKAIDADESTLRQISYLDQFFVFGGNPMDIATDKRGRLYINNLPEGNMTVFDSLSNRHTQLDGQINLHGSRSVGVPTSVALDSLGRVYIAEAVPAQKSRGAIYVFSPYEDGFKPIARIDGIQTPAGFSYFSAPTDIVLDGTRVYVADSALPKDIGPGNNTVWRLRFDDANADGVFDRPSTAGRNEPPKGTSTKPDKTPPRSLITKVHRCKKKATCAPLTKSLTTHQSIARVDGLASDGPAGSGIKSVQIAIGKGVRKGPKGRGRARKCKWLSKSGPQRAACGKPVFLKATLMAPDKKRVYSWRYKLNAVQRRAIGRGRWVIRSRAQDQSGNSERLFKLYRNLGKYRYQVAVCSSYRSLTLLSPPC